MDDPGMAFEVAARLTDYVIAIEPVRREAVNTPRTRRTDER
jgi:hypothetical protein